MKKKIHYAATFLLILALSISALLYVLLDVVQFDFKLAAKDDIEEGGHLQTIKLSLREFNNNKKDELWHNGELYDVRSYVIINDTVFISVFQDEREAQIIKSITESFDSSLYANDGFSHISKHHLPPFGGGKILVALYKIKFIAAYNTCFPFSPFIEYASVSSFDVIKPPPWDLI